jgi:hypothetical protein
MRKIFSFFAAMLVAVAVNAQEIPSTDFAAPGYTFTADAATIIGNPPADKVYLDETANPHHIAWSDVSKSVENAVIWKINATRGCYVTVSLDLGPVIASNKHIFCVEILDANGARVDSIAEGPNYTGDGFTDHDVVKVLDGQVLIPAAGEYTIQLKNNRDWCKGSIKNVILTYAADAPEPQHTYTVAGAPAALFGQEWNASYAENDMVFLANQSYMWIKDSVALSAGTVEFKVVEDHAWAQAWPEQNYKLAIPEDGYYSIIIAFNLAADPDSIVEGKAVKVGEIEPAPEYSLWNVVSTTDTAAGAIYVDNEYMKIQTVYKGTIVEHSANIFDETFTHAIQVRVDNFPTAENPTGTKKDGSTPLVITAKKSAPFILYYVRQAIDKKWTENDNKDMILFDQAAPTTKLVAASMVEDSVLADSSYYYIGKAFELVEGHTYTLAAKGTTIKLLGFKYPENPEPQHTYTVAGAPATLFGQEWNASYAENDMESYGTDTYFWRRDSVALAAGNVEFKIVEDHGWAKGWPDKNYVIKIDSAGIYNITISFKPKAEVADSMISVVVYKVGDAVVLPTIILHGNFTGEWKNTENFAFAEDNLTASLKMNLTAGTYEFGMKFDGVWKANGAELTREAPETSLLEGNGNMKITADVDGEYIFTYTFLGEQLAVTYPAAAPAAPTIAPEAPTEAEDDVLAIYCDKYATNNLHFGISGWAGAYDVLTIDSTKIAYWKAMTWECIIDPAHTDDAHDLSGYKKLHVDFWAPAAAKIKFTVEAVAGGNYKDGVVLDLAAGWNCFDIEVALWPNNYDFKNVKCLVLEQYQTPDGASFEGNPFAVANIYFFEKEAEGIDNTAVDAKAVKSLENGILVIRKNGKAYTVTGLEIK